jgi:hypothetical protein
MTSYWKRSRVTKALTDADRAGSFSEAEARLDAVQVAVAVGEDQLGTPAGQAAALTAVATARKCFGRVVLIATTDAPLIAPLLLGGTLLKAARRLGAKVAAQPTNKVTHTIRIGSAARSGGWDLRCWWDRWLSGTRAFDHEALGDSRLPLAGVFAGAAAVRQVFAGVLADRNIRERDVTVSLWTPSLSNGKYQRVWFHQSLQPEEVVFDANVFLLKKETAEKLTVPAPASAVLPSGDESSPASPSGTLKDTNGQPTPVPPSVVIIRLSGEVPPEQWNKVGIKLIPKLRSTNGLHIEVVMSGNVDGASAANFLEEVNQAINDLGLQAKLNVKCE